MKLIYSEDVVIEAGALQRERNSKLLYSRVAIPATLITNPLPRDASLYSKVLRTYDQ